jgi:hypothetical protein
MYCEKGLRNNTRKLTIAVIFECHFCFYPLWELSGIVVSDHIAAKSSSWSTSLFSMWWGSFYYCFCGLRKS